MRKALSKRMRKADDGELLPEYRFDYARSRPNRFARPGIREVTTIVLDEDVASVFRTSDAVNTALRALLGALPGGRGSSAVRRRANKRKDLTSGARSRRSPTRS